MEIKENFYLETHMKCARQIYLSLLINNNFSLSSLNSCNKRKQKRH